MNEIELDEHLDSLNPLRHLQDNNEELIPSQLPSTQLSQTTLSFPTDINITLTVDAQPGCGGIAWPAGEVLSTYLTSLPPSYLSKHKNILELGSGTGLVGLVAGKILQRENASSHVWITDQSPLLPIMSQNTLKNSLSSHVSVLELSWGLPLPPKFSPPNRLPTLLLLADCIYFEPAFPLLVSTLTQLSTPSTEILFCYKKRRKGDKRFFGLLKKEFTWSEVEDDPHRETYAREAISLLRLVKKA